MDIPPATDDPVAVPAARVVDRAGRTIDVVVTVKASPQPSAKYGDTVCVAGIALEPLRLVRLYPVPFRYLDGPQQFDKYDVIRVRVRDAGADKRPESLKIDANSLRVVGHLRGWRARAPYVEPLVGGSLCGMQAAAEADLNAPSLGILRPRTITGLTFVEHPGWSPEQIQRFVGFAQQGDLFREQMPRMIRPPRLTVRLDFSCDSTGCAGHQPTIIDWELTALQHRYPGTSRAQVEAAVRRRFETAMYGPDRAAAIYVGNQEKPTRRVQYMVLGTYYPRAADATVPLF